MSRRRRNRQPRTIQDFVRAGVLRPVQPTTATGWTRYGTGREFMPAATNYIYTPDFGLDSNADGVAENVSFASNSVTGTPTYSLVSRGGGRYAQRIQYTGVAGDAAGNLTIQLRVLTASGSFAAGDPMTVSTRLSGSISGCSLSLYAYTKTAASATVDTISATGITPTSVPVRYSASLAAAGADSSFVLVIVQVSQIGTGDTVDLYAEDLMVEKAATVSSYFDGGSSDCAWTGTAHNSPSTRTVSALTIPTALSNTAWTVAGRYTAPWAHNDSLAHNLLTLYASSDARATVYKHSDNKLYASVNDGTDTVTSASAASTLAANTVNCFTARSTWASTVDVSLNGTSATQGDASAVAAQTITAVTLGGTPNGYVGPVVLSPERKTDAWVTGIQSSSGAAFASPVQLVRDYMDVGDHILPCVGDATAYIKVGGGSPFESLGVLVIDGDSLSSATMSIKWGPQYVRITSWDYHNVAASGQGSAAMLADATTDVDVWYDADAKHNVVTCWVGANDLEWDTVYTNIVAYAKGRRDAGFKVVVFTCLPQSPGDEGYEEARVIFNAAMVANWAGFADALADVDAETDLADPTDTTYYADGVHLTEAGYAIVANVVKTAIETIL